MDFTYENQGINTYLVYQLKEEDQLDSLTLGMITNNKINGIAPAVYTQLDEKKYVKYNISSKIAVSEFFQSAVTKKRLVGVFHSICTALLSAEEYMIEDNALLLDLEYIYADVTTCEAFLICLPLSNLSEQDIEPGKFFKEIMFSTQFDQSEDCDYVAKIISYLNGKQIFSIADFKEVLDQLMMDSYGTVVSGYNGDVGRQDFKCSSQSQPLQQQNVFSQPIQNTMHQPTSNSNIQAGCLPGAQQVPRQPIQSSQPQPMRQQQMQQPQSVQKPQGETLQPGSPSMVHSQNPVPPIAATQQTARPIPSNMNSKQPLINIPNQKLQTPVNTTNQPENEKPMSMGYLLMHYSKENKQKYKEQKDRMAALKEVKKKPPMAVPGMAQNATTQNVSYSKVPSGLPIPNKASTPSRPMAIPGTASENQMQSPMQPETQMPQMSQHQFSAGRADFGETTVLGASAGGETTVLSQATAIRNRVYLLRMKNQEQIPLNKPIFRIGKEKSYVDYFIGDNTAISRSHANIVEQNGEYFVIDTNSTNHTYINGQMIPSNTQTRIYPGTIIRFANEEFEFRKE